MGQAKCWIKRNKRNQATCAMRFEHKLELKQKSGARDGQPSAHAHPFHPCLKLPANKHLPPSTFVWQGGGSPKQHYCAILYYRVNRLNRALYRTTIHPSAPYDFRSHCALHRMLHQLHHLQLWFLVESVIAYSTVPRRK